MDLTTVSMMAARNELHSRVIAIPGVFATSVGFRHVAGVMTNDMAICVHVMNKMPLRELAGAARIPTAIDGLRIDVVEGRPPRLAADKVRPVNGGIEVGGYGLHYGTLGCMVKDKDCKNYMLSNEHVFGGVGTATYQPASFRVCDQIGWVTKAESLRQGKMDCAISDLKKYNDGGLAEIKGIGAVEGTCQLSYDDTISKSGAETNVTTGLVVNTDYTFEFDGLTVTGQIRVFSGYSTRTFGGQGDSGAVVVTRGTGQDGGKCWVGGLLWGIGATQLSPNVYCYGYATPIDTVLQKMEVEVVTSSPSAAQPPSETPLDRIAALLNQSRRGQTYWQSFVRNQDQLQRLFAESPRLAVMLREIPQDALMDAVLKASVEPDSPIPSQIGGVDTGEVFASFASALTHCIDDGELRSDIQGLSKHLTHNVGRSWRDALSDEHGS
jgi:hypothetical protein